MNLKRFTKKLRQNPTDVESILWYLLRNRRLQNCKFRRQVEVGPYIVDFLSYEKNLIIEADGGQHNEDKNILKDQGRYSPVRYKNQYVQMASHCQHFRHRNAGSHHSIYC